MSYDKQAQYIKADKEEDYVTKSSFAQKEEKKQAVEEKEISHKEKKINEISKNINEYRNKIKLLHFDIENIKKQLGILQEYENQIDRAYKNYQEGKIIGKINIAVAVIAVILYALSNFTLFISIGIICILFCVRSSKENEYKTIKNLFSSNMNWELPKDIDAEAFKEEISKCCEKLNVKILRKEANINQIKEKIEILKQQIQTIKKDKTM